MNKLSVPFLKLDKLMLIQPSKLLKLPLKENGDTCLLTKEENYYSNQDKNWKKILMNQLPQNLQIPENPKISVPLLIYLWLFNVSNITEDQPLKSPETFYPSKDPTLFTLEKNPSELPDKLSPGTSLFSCWPGNGDPVCQPEPFQS